jgi:cobalt-zinc-cadmium efflux system membrane fusion protein
LKLEYNRQTTLSDENVNPRKTFQEVKSKLAVEKARAQAAKNKLQALNVSLSGNSSLIPIVSPISGYVGKISITKGAFAETGITLFEVVDNSQMHLDLNVFEKDLGKISVGHQISPSKVKYLESINLFLTKVKRLRFMQRLIQVMQKI